MSNVLDFMMMIIAALTFAFVCCVFAAWIDALMKRNVWFRGKMDKLMDINRCVLTHEQRIEVANKINLMVIDFMDDWNDGDSNICTIDLLKLKLGGYDAGVEEEITLIEGKLGIEIESWLVNDDEELELEINTYYLKKVYRKKMSSWEYENRLQEEEYWSDRGVI